MTQSVNKYVRKFWLDHVFLVVKLYSGADCVDRDFPKAKFESVSVQYLNFERSSNKGLICFKIIVALNGANEFSQYL